jgi:adenylylsulfate kinase
VGGLEFISKIGLYWIHERAWDRLRVGIQEVQPAVVWFTGLSGAGKSTIAKDVSNKLRGRSLRVEELDGDSIRDIFPSTGFTKADRDAHISRVGYLASKLEQNGVFVVASFVSPYRESRQFVRGLCKNFIEVHVATPLEVCEARDVKGLYAKARHGEIANFTGISDPYEPPVNPDVVIDTANMDVDGATRLVMSEIRRRAGKAWK